MNAMWIGIVAALGGALIGASASLIQMVLNHFREKGQHNDSLLVTALQFLAGNENERSCGISMIEGVFCYRKEYVGVLVPALTSQAVYLLLHTEATASRTEFYNWLRIMGLLKALFERFQIVGDYYGEIGNAFLIKRHPGHRGGVDIPFETLKIWAKKYSMNLDLEL